MKLTDNWFTSLSQNEEGNLIFVTGRLDLEEFRLSRKLKICVEIKWPYLSDAEGMPLDEDAIAQGYGEGQISYSYGKFHRRRC